MPLLQGTGKQRSTFAEKQQLENQRAHLPQGNFKYKGNPKNSCRRQ